MYSNFPSGRVNSDIIVSDHFGTITKIKGALYSVDCQNTYYRKTNLRPHEWECFNAELNYTLQNRLFYLQWDGCLDENSYANCIVSTYHDLIEKYMPLKRLTRKQKRFHGKPWLIL